jgi:uncharacterized delta-60 repeat protein
MKKNKIALSVYIFSLSALALHATPGELDLTFGIDGVVLTNISRADFINGCTVQPDDSIVVAGESDGYFQRIAAARYTTNGELDTTFNDTGTEAILIGSLTSGSAVTLQADDKIVITGYSSGGQTTYVTTRLNTDGTPDTSFNSIGYVETLIGAGSVAYSVLVQPDSKIVVGGLGYTSQAEIALARYHDNGEPDDSFGVDGIASTIIGYEAIVYRIALQSDGKIIAGGYQWDPSLGVTFCLVRYNDDGSRDTDFGVDGIVITAIGGESKISSLAIQDDGYILAGGYTTGNDGVPKCALARYDTTGALDTTFGTGGVAITQIQYESKTADILLQSDGSIIIGGYSYGDLATQFALARYTSSGIIDTSFGIEGVTLTTIGGHNSDARITSLAFQSDGSVIAAGYSGGTMALARYLTT